MTLSNVLLSDLKQAMYTAYYFPQYLASGNSKRPR
jgi:hypothetical protein